MLKLRSQSRLLEALSVHRFPTNPEARDEAQAQSKSLTSSSAVAVSMVVAAFLLGNPLSSSSASGVAWTQEMGALPLSGLNLNRNQTGQSGPYCKLRPTRAPYF